MIESETMLGNTRVIFFKTLQEALDYAIQKEGRDQLYRELDMALKTGMISFN